MHWAELDEKEQARSLLERVVGCFILNESGLFAYEESPPLFPENIVDAVAERKAIKEV